MNCAVHTDVPAAAYCRTCGKALCATCKHDVRGVIFCEDCIARRLTNTLPSAPAGATVVPGSGPAVVVAPADTGPSPALAAVLGFIPGVGAMYNGQFIKALVHVVIFGTLIWAADNVSDMFGLGIAFWVFYMVFDAYKTAKARQIGEPPPDPFGFERLWGGGGAPVARPAATMVAGEAGAVPPEMAPGEDRRTPVGAIVLIGLGVMFLADTLGFWHWHWLGRFWPVILIVLGVWTWMKRRPEAS
jgi:TM2 domain-containing membrane protein YozV